MEAAAYFPAATASETEISLPPGKERLFMVRTSTLKKLVIRPHSNALSRHRIIKLAL